MALTDKNIVITPNIGSASADPNIVFTGANANTSATITLKAYPTNGGTLSIEGSVGQLFSIVNTMTGVIYSVNDVSGLPSIQVTDAGLITLAGPGNGYVFVASTTPSTTTATGALVVTGGVGIGGSVNVGGNVNVVGSLTATGGISGTATTATNVYQTNDPANGTYRLLLGNATNANGSVYNKTALYWNDTGSIIQGANISGTAAYLAGFTNSTSATPIAGPDTATQNGIGYVNSISLFGQGDGALYTQAYSSSWEHQIFGDYRTGQIAIRGKQNGTWGAWRTVLDSTNLYASYASTLWNNSNKTHATYTSFGGTGSPTDFGDWFIHQDAAYTDGPSAINVGGGNTGQYYTSAYGLGSDYTYAQYAMQSAIGRNVTQPYHWVRYLENGTWQAWTKAAAGYADTAGSAGSATTAGSATNISGGVLGNLVYQTGQGTTGFIATGTTNQVLLSQAPGLPPIWGSVPGAGSATNISGGVAGNLVYQSGPGATGFVTTGTTAGLSLLSPAPGLSPTWGTPASATNISGGVAGNLLYQSGPGATGFVTTGTSAGLSLISQGPGQPPTWGTPTGATVSPTTNLQVYSIGVGTPASGTIGTIRAVGTITANYSDDQLKTKLGNITNALSKVMSLDGFYYEPSAIALALGYDLTREVGISAQQVQAVLPEVVVPAPIDEKYLTVHYERLIPLLIEAIKELKAEVDELKGQK